MFKALLENVREIEDKIPTLLLQRQTQQKPMWKTHTQTTPKLKNLVAARHDLLKGDT
jgi:hypothetical protein